MNNRTDISDLRTALEVLRNTSGQLIETNVEVDPAAELSGVYRYVGVGGTVMRPTTVDGPAPCQEVVHQAGDAHFDLFKLIPAPTNTPVDAGPYITLGMRYATHPDTGLSDVTIHRMRIRSKDGLSIFLQPGSRHTGAMAERATELGQPLPISLSAWTWPSRCSPASGRPRRPWASTNCLSLGRWGRGL